jgi:sigma-B regulation protein RsbU (phosphoserine phosphatase)
VVADAEIEERSVELRPGDVLVLCTDGITEAMAPDDALFGEHRLVDELRRHGALPAREILAAIERVVAGFTAGAPQADDATLLVLRCTMPGPDASPGGPDRAGVPPAA